MGWSHFIVSDKIIKIVLTLPLAISTWLHTPLVYRGLKTVKIPEWSPQILLSAFRCGFRDSSACRLGWVFVWAVDHGELLCVTSSHECSGWFGGDKAGGEAEPLLLRSPTQRSWRVHMQWSEGGAAFTRHPPLVISQAVCPPFSP